MSDSLECRNENCELNNDIKDNDLVESSKNEINKNSESKKQNLFPEGPFKICSPFIKPPVLGGFSKGPINILKPSSLSYVNCISTQSNALSSVSSVSTTVSKMQNNDSNIINKTSSSFLLNPPRLNSFIKSPNKEEPLNRIVRNEESQTKVSSNVSSTQQQDGNKIAENNHPSFVPLDDSALISSSSSTGSQSGSSVSSSPFTFPSSTSPSATSNFVFGQNLHERIVKDESAKENAVSNGITSTSQSTSPLSSPSKLPPPTESSSSSMLFSSMIKEEVLNDKEDNISDNSKKSLTESAKEYEETHVLKRKYEEVALITGEEDEDNMLQINCKLFTFDNTTSNWVEKGRGILRVNKRTDSDGCSYRLIMRISGSYRVILNAKVWSDMLVDRASKKGLRFTATADNGHIKIHSLIGSQKDMDDLERLLKTVIHKKKQWSTD